MRRFLPIPTLVLLLVSLVIAFAIVSPVAAQEEKEKPAAEKAAAKKMSLVPKVPQKVRSLMQDRKYAEAIKAIDEVLKKAAPKKGKAPAKDYLTYLKARAFHLQKKYDMAIAVYSLVEKNFPKSGWARRARFGKAVSYAHKGDYIKAEAIYEKEVTFLLSADRKQQLADIYLEFADVYFSPPKEQINKKPDFNKALKFYGKALEIGPKSQKKIEIELLIAQCYQNLRNFGQATSHYTKFIKDHPKSDRVIEAKFRLGQCQLSQNQFAQARRTWKDLLADHGEQNAERIAEAAYNLSKTYRIPAPTSDEDLSLGVASLESFVEKYPKHKLASRAYLNIAQSYMVRGRFEDAVKSLKRFLSQDRYAKTEEVPEARRLMGRSYQRQKKFDEALSSWREYLTKHPTHKAWSAVQQAIVATEYLIGAELMNQKKFDEARKSWSQFLVKYPLDRRAPHILYQFGLMNLKQDKYKAAIADWTRLVSKYPGTNPASQAQFMIALVREEKLGNLEEALQEYKKVTWGSYRHYAQRRVRLLTAKSLRVETDRIFRTNETPTLKLSTRNIEELTIESYTVDLETYFRKMHLARGVESLDISLIDPDSRVTFKIPKYAKHKQLESLVEVPLPVKKPAKKGAKGGVMAVTISSKTLTATTLVIQSDLDVIVKSSREEVFVFAQNMRTGKVWPGVRLLVSDGKQVFAEVKTGKDGVMKETFKELKAARDVRVFAVAHGSVASNIVSLSGVGVARGLADKGYIYTDRPAYRAGQVVHVRGVIRRVSDDTYKVEKGKKFKVSVLDNRSRLLHEAKIALNDFGSFHTHFILPQTSPQGNYRISVSEVYVAEDTSKSGKLQSYQGSFIVHEYKLEPVILSVDTKRSVYYRGEQIEGKITAKYYYGAPLVGRQIRYQLAGGRTFTAKTDNKGQVKFKLPTRDYHESRTLSLTATLSERNLTSAKNFFLATQGFNINVSTLRPVYLAGDTFEARVKAVDAEGKPIAKKLTLHVLERTRVEGRSGERLVEKHELATDKDKGIALKTLKLEKGAEYIIRAEGVDRFQNKISGQWLVRISDDEDSVRLRILADKHTLKVGDTANVILHWREKPALALITYQGAKVLDYKIVQLKKGINKLPIPMTAKLAPNFDLSVAVMVDKRAPAKKEAPTGKVGTAKPVRRFYSASSPFNVERQLQVKIETRRAKGAKGPVRPGEKIELIVTTTDPQGKPVVAEVSLAMIERSLLDRFGFRIPPIEKFFQGSRRQSAVRTSSSISFSYRPRTRAINPRLLAERDRIELAREEAETLSGLNVIAAGEGAGEEELAGSPIVYPIADLVLPIDNARELLRNSLMMSRAQNAPAQQLSQEAIIGRRQSVITGLVPFVDSKLTIYPHKDVWRRLRVNPNQGDDAQGDYYGYSMYSMSGYDGKGTTAIGHLARTITAADVQHFSSKTNGPVILFSNGQIGQWAFNQGKLDEKDARALAARLTKAGAILLPAMVSQETGYWNPTVVTDKKGKATLKLTVPERSTAWKLLAKGVTRRTLAGEATDELVAKKDLFGQLKLPLSFTDGDQAQIVASVHNSALDKGAKVQVTLKTTVGGKSTTETKTLVSKGKGVEELIFKTLLKRPDQLQKSSAQVSVSFELNIESGQHKDVIRRTLPLHPYGLPIYVTASGQATSDAAASVTVPKNMTSRSLQILVGPTVEQSLLDIVLGAAPACQIDNRAIATGLDSSISDLMASIGLQKLLGDSRESTSPQMQALDSRIRAALGLLISSQNNDGSWSWTGRSGTGNRNSSARAMWALSLAKSAGYTVSEDALNRGIKFLESQVATTRTTDYESKAILIHALAVAGKGDFRVANRLYRNRPALSSGALVYLALAFAEMDRKNIANELLDLLSKRNLDEVTQVKGKSLPWNHAGTELRGLVALAIQRAAAAGGEASPTAKKLVEWLMAHRTGHRWAPEKATGPAALAVTQWYSRSRFKGEHYKLKLFVNDVLVKELDVKEDAGTLTVDVPAKFFSKKEKQRINFRIVGRGRYTYQCILGGFVPADKLVSTTKDWRVERYYEPAQLELDGKAIPRGFGVLQGSYTRFRNPLTQMPVGKRGRVELRVSRYNVPTNTPQEHLEYLVVTEPLPSGTTVVEKSVTGNFERFEISPGKITFYIGSRPYIGAIRYTLHGYLPGKYRSAPTVIRNAYRADQIAVAKPKQLDILPLGSKSKDKYRLSPLELWELGKRHFDKGNLKVAAGHLTQLFSNWNLRPDYYKRTAKMLLDAHLETGPARKIVFYFEIIKERWKDLEIPFDQIVKVGHAYHEIGEYEPAYIVFRATAESSFQRERSVAGFLQSQGEFLRSVAVMSNLLREYPPEPYVATASYTLSQQVYSMAPKAATDPKLREKKINRIDLVRQALAMLGDFLTAYPEDPAADQASFSVAGALLELKAYKDAIAACNRYAERYPESEYLDSYWYVIGYCHFAQSAHKQALQMCQKVADAKRLDKKTGREVESRNKWQAVYIMGQVHHSLGKAAEAIKQYEKVKDRFADAAQAIHYFARKQITLPEVTTFKPGEPANVELKFRNVASCDTKVYRIDLMKFGLLKKNLGGITKINLSGIRPHHEATIKLGDGKDYRDRTHKLVLPLKEEGAYLIVCRGDNLHTSGLVLVTPLEVKVLEQASSGRVRTTVKNVVKDNYVADVHVKVIGSNNRDFVSGETDLRGIFVADNIQGRSTIIARADTNRYAFFRGKQSLGRARPPALSAAEAAPFGSPSKKPVQGKPDQAKPGQKQGQGQLLEQIFEDNYKIQRIQSDQLNKQYKQKSKGVYLKDL